MRTAKVLSGLVAGLIAFIVLALAAVWLLVNPNDYKSRIAAAVKEATGRELLLTGGIKLSVFPWVALQLGPASLGNPPGFGGAPFLSFQRASVRARLWPLLRRRLEIGGIEIDGLDLRLQRDPTGRGNWEGFGQSNEKTAAPQQAGRQAQLQGIAGIRITRASVRYQALTLNHVNLETGSFAAEGVVPISLTADADRGVPGEHANLDARLDLSFAAGGDRYRIDALAVNSTLMLAGDERPVRFEIASGAIDVDRAVQTVSVPRFALNLAGAQVTGNLSVASFIDAPQMTGVLSLAPLVLREYLPRLDLVNPRTRDPKAWALLAAGGRIAYGNSTLRLAEWEATLDETHLRGGLAMNFDKRAVNFDLSADRVDIDRYLPPVGAPVGPPAKPARTGAAKSATAPPWEAAGTLALGAVHFAPLDLAEVHVSVASREQVLHLFPLKAQIDGGQYSGDMTLDRRSATPILSLDEHLSGIDVGKLLASRSNNLRVSGRGNLALKATAHGADAAALLKSLGGTFDSSIAGGAVEGVDLAFELGRAEALLRHQDAPNLANTRRTPFDAFKMSAQITDGVARTRDLLISSPVLKLTGQGSANLATQALDFNLLADTLRTMGNTAVEVPVKVTGTFADPTVRPDVDALVKGVLKQKLKDVLQDKLKGLFGTP